MKIFHILIVVNLLLVMGCEQKAHKSLNAEKEFQLDSLVARYHGLNRFSGSIMIAKSGHIVYDTMVGKADFDSNIAFTDSTAYKIGTLSQFVTRNLLNELINSGEISTQDSLSNLLLNEAGSDMTLSQWLQNDSTDFNLMGRIIEMSTGKSLDDHLENYTIRLGLQNTFYKELQGDIAVGHLYHNYRGHGLEYQRSPQYTTDSVFSNRGLKSTADDLFRMIEDNPVAVDKSGYLEDDGFSYAMKHDTLNNLTIILLSNIRHPVAGEMIKSIEAILHSEDYRLPLERKSINLSEKALVKFTGTYAVNDQMRFELILEGDTLYVLLGPIKEVLIPQSDQQFYMLNNDASMRFEADSNGNIASVLLLDGFIDSNQKAIRIKD